MGRVSLSDPAGDGAVLLAGEGLDLVAVGGGGDPGLVDAAAHEVLADGDHALLGELLVDLGVAGLLVGLTRRFSVFTWSSRMTDLFRSKKMSTSAPW